MKNISISVVIPCYNVEKWVGDAVQSCLNQTHLPLEIILVDDGSMDGTLQILYDLERQNSDLIKVLSGPNQGAPVARNRGLNIARGEYIQFLDADDYLLPEKLSSQIKCIQEHNGKVDLVVSPFFYEDANRIRRLEQPYSDDVWRGLIYFKLGNTCSNLWRVKLLLDIGGWDETLQSTQDYNLIFRVLRSTSKTFFTFEALTVIRGREGSISRPQSTLMQKKHWIRMIRMKRQIKEYLVREGLFSFEMENDLLRFYFKGIRTLYTYDSDLALQYHRELIPPKHIPFRDSSFNWKGRLAFLPYCFLYRLFGFELAENMAIKYPRILGR